MIFALLLVMCISFVAGMMFGYNAKKNSGLEGIYRKALLKIGSGQAGDPQLEAQLALEKEEEK